MGILKMGTLGCLIFAAFNLVSALGNAGQGSTSMQQVIVFVLLALVFAVIWGIAAGTRKLLRR